MQNLTATIHIEDPDHALPTKREELARRLEAALRRATPTGGDLTVRVLNVNSEAAGAARPSDRGA